MSAGNPSSAEPHTSDTRDGDTSPGIAPKQRTSPPTRPIRPIRSIQRWGATLPDGPRFAALQSLKYMRDPFGYYEEMQARYGDLVSMPTMNGHLIVALSPEGAREILAGREEDFGVGFGAEAAKPIIGPNSLLLISGEAHKRERKTLSPTFHGARMRAYAPIARDAALAELASWGPGDELSMQECMQRVSLDVILHAVFGVQSESLLLEFRAAIRDAIEELNPLPIFFRAFQRELWGHGPWAKFLRGMRRLDALIEDQIREARASSAEREDVISRLVHARGEDGQALPDRTLRDHLLTLLLAGHETTATTLAWAFYELMRNPSVYCHLRDEIAELGRDPSPDELVELPYLDAFCRETLRVHPILAEFFRTVKTGFRLQGYDVPAGVALAGAIITIHRNEQLYPEPDRFRPERFLERRFAPWEFVAFGGGHRHCIGAAFAMSELKVVLGTILPRCELELVLDRPLRTIRRNLTLGPERGVPARVLGAR